MSRHFVKQLADGDTIDDVFLVAEKQLRANKSGNLYLQLELTDRTGGIEARMWNAGEKLFRSFEEGDFLHVAGKVQLFQGSLQMIVNEIESISADQVDLQDFLPRTERDISTLFEQLRTHLLRLEDPHLRALAECFLIDEQLVDAFCKVPAGIRNHHAYIGGLLEHVVTLMEAANRLAPLYREINRDLLMMGIFLHDIGKTRELSFTRIFAYTDEGQLVGHLITGVEMLNEKVAKVPDLTGEPFPQELFLRLKHMIVSHHGTYEFGSAKLPMTPEAIALHYLDNLDAKVHSFCRDIREDRNQTSDWTPFNHAIGRRLYKGSRNSSNGTT